MGDSKRLEEMEKWNEDIWHKAQTLARATFGIIEDLKSVEPDLDDIEARARRVMQDADWYQEYYHLRRQQAAADPNQMKLEVPSE